MRRCVVAVDMRIAGTASCSFLFFLPCLQLLILYSRVRVVVAPLLSGAGVKGKVNQAMKYGTPVVTTPLAVEGMHASDSVDCMVGKSPQEFADKVMQVSTAAACGAPAAWAAGTERAPLAQSLRVPPGVQ